MNWYDEVKKCLYELNSSFQTSELAYLCLTSKAENAMRDRLAFAMHRKLHSHGFIVAREWSQRFDIAVLDNSCQPTCLIELKFNLSCDIRSATQTSVVEVELEKDRRKLRSAQTRFPNAECLQVLFLAFPQTPPEKNQDRYLKYVGKLRKDPVHTSEELVALVQQKCGLSHWGCLPTHRAFGISVSVYYWIFAATEADSETAFPALTIS